MLDYVGNTFNIRTWHLQGNRTHAMHKPERKKTKLSLQCCFTMDSCHEKYLNDFGQVILNFMVFNLFKYKIAT